ncbi:MAG: hypothetical protein CM1200mP2_13970 [Planctomycetaceae bacterium]|nr:MAG: hypothetical protein CM1200mP2_13970 [Planctomycetaceae bacterium]
MVLRPDLDDHRVVNAAFPDNFQAQLILGFLAPLGLDKVGESAAP